MQTTTRKSWTETEKNTLIYLYETVGLSAQEIAAKLERSHDALKIKIVRWGLKHSDEQTRLAKRRASGGEKNGMFGKSLRKGKTKETDESIAKGGRALAITLAKKKELGLLPDVSGQNNPMFGVASWNKGLNKESDERIKAYGITLSAAKKRKWALLSKEEKDLKRQQCARIGIQKKSSTSIEVKIQKFLDSLSVKYQVGFDVKYYTCDLFLPECNLIIECQGDYWHANPRKYALSNINQTQAKNVRRDKAKKTYLTNLGYQLLYLWEFDINFKWPEVEKLLVSHLTKPKKSVT